MRDVMQSSVQLGDVFFWVLLLGALVAAVLALRWWVRLSAKQPQKAIELEAALDAWARSRGLDQLAALNLTQSGADLYGRAKLVEYDAKVKAATMATAALDAAKAAHERALKEVADARGKLSAEQLASIKPASSTPAS